jgi:hypothetical protein
MSWISFSVPGDGEPTWHAFSFRSSSVGPCHEAVSCFQCLERNSVGLLIRARWSLSTFQQIGRDSKNPRVPNLFFKPTFTDFVAKLAKFGGNWSTSKNQRRPNPLNFTENC